jgi:PAS domain S-box-containing protein
MITPRILIVDDEIIIAREIEARLTAMGYAIAGIASAGDEAVRVAMECKPDLVLMDIVIKGGMDGIDAAEAIRQECQVPIIYVTAYTDEKTLERARLTEPFAYLVKPFSERELKANIEMALYKSRTERRLRKVERWLSETVDELTHAVISTDIEGRITYFNRGAEAITAWKRDEALGRRVDEVFRLIDRTSGATIAYEAAAEGPVVSFQEDVMLLDRSEKPVPIQNTTTVLRDTHDRPMGTVSVFRDPTGTRHGAMSALNADVALALSQSLTLPGMLQLCTESIVRHFHASFARVWVTDQTGEFLILEASAGLYTHLDGDHSRIRVGEFKIGRIAADQKTHLTNDVFHDPQISHPDWARHEGLVAFAGYPLTVDGRLLGVMGLFSHNELSDVTLDVLASISRTISVGIERKRLEEQLRQSQKSESLGQLAAGIAHDFNNLLTIIASCGELLSTSNSLNAEDKVLIREIEQASTRASTLTRQLLAFSRKQVTEPTTFDVNDLVVNLEQMLRRLIGEDVELSTALDPSLYKVTADIGQIEQVVLNLVINARDAMARGGRLTIETGNVALDREYTQARPEVVTGDYALIAVSDTGCGMPPEVLSRVFDPYFTTKESGKGTGLGLATVFGIVKQWGGHISAYSEPGVGSTFKVYLPRSAGDLSKTEESGLLATLPEGQETVLVVEDDDSVRGLTIRVLNMCGYNVLEANSGEQALQLAEQHKEPIALIITDVVMPQMGGPQLVERIASIRPEIRVMFMSGYTDDTVIRHGILEAKSHYLEKPFTPRTLAQKVRAVLDDPGRDTK